MHKIFTAAGKFHWLTDADGKSVEGKSPAWDVVVDAKYELRPSPHQPLVLDIWGYGLIASSQCTYRLVLDNGVVLSGPASGGGTYRSGEPPKLRKVRMYGVDKRQVELHPTNTAETPADIDCAVFSVLSSDPLEIGNGFVSPSRPFTFTRNSDCLKRSIREALRLHHGDLEITVVGASEYWRKMVDTRTLHLESIVGVRRKGGGDLPWKDLNDVTNLLSKFLGWLNHCVAPVFHVKAYRKGRLVYRGYDLYPHPTVERDLFSWFPRFGIKDSEGNEADGDIYADLMQELLDGFATTWEENRMNNGTFHIALQLLRAGTKGGPGSRSSITYLRDTFTACAILERMLTGKSDKSGRQAQMERCRKAIGVKDKLPDLKRKELELVTRDHPELWWAKKKNRILEAERKKATMSRPLANLQNWLLHLDDPENSNKLLGLGSQAQEYLVEVSIWLADLMLLKVVGYNGWYFNRLSMETEKVPWAIGP